jgi:Domain of unknown function (DUF4062)
MAKPRVFVSSTYYDLRHIRAVLEAFIKQFGYDPVLFEKGTIPFQHDKSLEENCLSEIEACDILILIIGGRYGSLSREDQELLKSDSNKFFNIVRSVTRKEYEKARERDIPIFIFVESGVLSEYRTFQENRSSSSIKYAHVDDKRIYEMLDDIFTQRRNNFVRGFSGHEEIIDWLREQWAGLFADSLKKRQTEIKLKSLESQISELSNVVSSLKSYSEEIVKIINKDDSGAIIRKVNQEFRERQVQTFVKERLIDFVKDLLKAKEGKGLTDEELFERFWESKDVLDFAKRVGLDPHVLDFEAPKKDYDDLKIQYRREAKA